MDILPAFALVLGSFGGGVTVGALVLSPRLVTRVHRDPSPGDMTPRPVVYVTPLDPSGGYMTPVTVTPARAVAPGHPVADVPPGYMLAPGMVTPSPEAAPPSWPYRPAAGGQSPRQYPGHPAGPGHSEPITSRVRLTHDPAALDSGVTPPEAGR